jgi:hypothetical protein
MTRPSPQRLAQLGIGVQFLAIIRTLGEFFRLRHVHGAQTTLAIIAPFVTGALIAAVGTAISVLCYFLDAYRAAARATALTIAALLAYKFIVIG